MTTRTSQTTLDRVAFALLWLFVFTIPLAQATEIPGIGLISRLTGFAALAAGVAAVMTRRRFRLLGGFHMMMGGFILWSAVTLWWSVSPDATVQRIVTYLQLFVLVMVIWELCREEIDVLCILNAFVLGTIVPALSTLEGFLPGQKVLFERAARSGFDPNALAFMLAISLPVSYYLILQHKTALTGLYRLQMGIAFCGAVLYGSAATLVAVVIGLSLVCWTIQFVGLRSRRNAFALMLILGAMSLLMLPAHVANHILDETRKGGISMTSILDTGVQSIQTTPVGGFGAGTLTASADDRLKTPHSSFVMFEETGVVGVVTFIAVLGILFLAAEEMNAPAKAFWMTVLAVWSIGVCTLTWECTQSAWLLLGLLAAHAASLKEEASRSPVKAKPVYCIEQEAEVWS